MILGLSLVQFTYLHVFMSLIGIGAGIFIIFGLLTSRRLSILTSLFLITTVLTSVTGFLYPFNGMTPGIVLGILSMIVLILAIIGLYVRKLAGAWRGIYVVSVMRGILFQFLRSGCAGLRQGAGTPRRGAQPEVSRALSSHSWQCF
jgi:hypothetical protein